MSRNDIVLFACGSRSMRSVGLPRSARAAARLMAVVVLPTPPFWFAMATIIRMTTNGEIVAGNSRIAGLVNGVLLSYRVGELASCRLANYRVTYSTILLSPA